MHNFHTSIIKTAGMYAFVFALAFAFRALAAGPTVSVEAVPRWPWNGKVDITITVQGGTPPFSVTLQGHDRDRNRPVDIHTLSLDGGRNYTRAPYITVSSSPKTIKCVWDAAADHPTLNASAFAVGAVLKPVYLIVNLETGEKRHSWTPPDLSDDACRTTELWLRWIPAGTFIMGSPDDELGRDSSETQHQVTLTQGYWMGVFEVTQKQYELITGGNPSYYKGDVRPVELVSYDDIRGTGVGASWPSGGHEVDAYSFLGKLRAKTGLPFDLPTEAQWEYACRAGTTTALNSGKNLTATNNCPNMAEVGRYRYNRSDGKGGYREHTKVGCYLPNAWGIYDMHGNVWEWCLDRTGNSPSEAVTDPQGPATGSYRVLRGGHWSDWGDTTRGCRSAFRLARPPSAPGDKLFSYGFRLVSPP